MIKENKNFITYNFASCGGRIACVFFYIWFSLVNESDNQATHQLGSDKLLNVKNTLLIASGERKYAQPYVKP